MSLAATEPMVHAPDHAEAHATGGATLANGQGLPKPSHTPTAAYAAFLLAGPGSVFIVSLLAFGGGQIARGASMSFWSLGIAAAVAVWLPSMVVALWAANARDEWGV